MHKNSLRLLLSFLFVAFLYFTWLYPPSRYYWDFLDEKCFRLLRYFVIHPGFSRDFWAIMNHKLTDWVLDLVFLIFILRYVLKEKPKRLERSVEMILMVVFTALVILSVNRFLLTEILELRRLSPSVALDDGFRLSQYVTWLKIKETHHACFPSDHATTNIFFFALMCRVMTKPWVIASFLIAILCSLPRMIVGAHWLTDALIGSLSIVLLSTTLFFDTGLFERLKTLFIKPSLPKGEPL